MPVTCIAVGDPHFMVSNVEDSKELIKKIGMLVDRLNPTFVVILGDLLHTHERVHVTPLKLVTKFIIGLSQKVQVFVIIGNHDLINHSQFLTDNHPFNSFKKLPNVKICDKVVSRKIGGKKFIFCPYVPPGRFEEALDTAGESWDNAQCIFAHQEFYGCQFNPTITSIDGDIWPDSYPLVVSGHIHNEQWLQENIYYTGSSMQHAFGESAKKTIAFLTFGETYKLQRVDLEMRKKRIVRMSLDDAENFEPRENVQYKLVLKGTPQEIRVFRSGSVFKKLQDRGLAVSFAPIEIEVGPEKIIKKRHVLDILQELVKGDDKYVHRAYKALTSKVKINENLQK